MKSIAFFSSDSRPLYKRNVFTMMTLPPKFPIHVRYQNKYVNFKPSELPSIVGKQCVIFFACGNDLSLPESERVIENISIREAIVKQFEITSDTGLIHFYLELGDFAQWTIIDNNSALLPSKSFVSEIEMEKGSLNAWFERIKAIEKYFPCQLFFKIEVQDRQGSQSKLVIPKYDKKEKHGYFTLQDEKEYLLNVAFYHTLESNQSEVKEGLIKNDQSLEMVFDNKIIQLNAPPIITIGGLRDNRSYNLYTQSLTSKNLFTFIHLRTLHLNNNDHKTPIYSSYESSLSIEITKNVERSSKFALFTVLTALSVGYGKVVADKFDLNGEFSFSLLVHGIIALSIGFISSYKLYQQFNKK